MRIEPKAAFYNEETGAVQPWKDIEVTDAVGSELVAEGLAVEIAGGGGGGGTKWHVSVDIPSISEYYLSLNATQEQDGNNAKITTAVTENGYVYVYYEEDLTSGLQKTFEITAFDESSEMALFMNEPEGYTASVTGDITFTSGDGWTFTVTGDGTITITAA